MSPPMHRFRLLGLFSLFVTMIGACQADIDGPTPLAWRWASGDVLPSGKPVVHDGVIYLAVGARVFALHGDTGNQLWKYPTTESVEGFFRYSPVISGDTLVESTLRFAYGIDLKTGKEKWRYRLTDPEMNFAVQPVGTPSCVVFQMSGEYLFALNSKDGKPTWLEPVHVFDHLKGDMATLEENVYYFTETNEMWVVDTRNPSKAKKLQTFDNLSSSATPVVYGDVVYVNSSSYVTAINAFSGTMKWERNTEQDLVYGPAVSPLGIASVSRDGILSVMELTGQMKSMKSSITGHMTSMQMDLQSGPAASPTAAGNFFVIPTIDGSIVMIDAKTGALIWRYIIPPMTELEPQKVLQNTVHPPVDRTGANVAAAGPAISFGNTLLLLCSDASLLCFDKATGVDMTGPEISMVYPNEGAEVNGENLAVAFVIHDTGTGVDPRSVSVFLNGKPVDNQYVPTGLDVAQFDRNEPKNKNLDEGRMEFEVKAKDWLGNSSDKKFSLLINNLLLPLAAPKVAPEGGKGAGRFPPP